MSFWLCGVRGQVPSAHEMPPWSPAAARTGGQVRRVHGDAPRGAGGAQEPPEQDGAQHHVPALPLAGPVPHGACCCCCCCCAGHPVPSQRRAGVESVGAASHVAAWIGFELRAPEPSRRPLSYARQTGSSFSNPLALIFSPPALMREILVGTRWSRDLSYWEDVIYTLFFFLIL